jgi:hypothetical protein
MSIEWLALAVALVVLFPPLPMSASLRRYVFRSRRNATATVKSLAGQWQNWIDFARAAAGTYILIHYAVTANPEIPGASNKALAMQGSILAAAVLVQGVRVGDDFRIVAPIFYLCGYTLALSGYEAGGFAIFAGFLFAIGAKKPTFELPLMAIALGAVGYVLDDISLHLILNCVLVLFPVVLGFLFRQPMAVVARMPAHLE